MKNIRKIAVVTFISALIGLAFPYVNFAVDQTYQQLKVIVDDGGIEERYPSPAAVRAPEAALTAVNEE